MDSSEKRDGILVSDISDMYYRALSSFSQSGLSWAIIWLLLMFYPCLVKQQTYHLSRQLFDLSSPFQQSLINSVYRSPSIDSISATPPFGCLIRSKISLSSVTVHTACLSKLTDVVSSFLWLLSCLHPVFSFLSLIRKLPWNPWNYDNRVVLQTSSSKSRMSPYGLQL